MKSLRAALSLFCIGFLLCSCGSEEQQDQDQQDPRSPEQRYTTDDPLAAPFQADRYLRRELGVHKQDARDRLKTLESIPR